MDEFMTGRELANAIADDREFFQAFVLGELTPFYKGQAQSYETSCVACVRATNSGQPDPFVCNTDPDPETYTDVIDGYSRHSSCGYAAHVEDSVITERLKYLSFRSKEVELYFNETGTAPAIIAETFEETWELVRKAPFTYDPSLKEKEIEAKMVKHLWIGNKYKGWGKSQEAIVREVTGKTGVTARQFFQRNVKPLLE